jgi:hypothetical protein
LKKRTFDFVIRIALEKQNVPFFNLAGEFGPEPVIMLCAGHDDPKLMLIDKEGRTVLG